MARIERQYDIKSTVINKEFLLKLFEILNNINPEHTETKTEITIYSEQEKSVFFELRYRSKKLLLSINWL